MQYITGLGIWDHNIGNSQLEAPCITNQLKCNHGEIDTNLTLDWAAGKDLLNILIATDMDL